MIYSSDMYMVYGNEVDETCYTNPYNCSSSSGKSESWFYESNIIGSGNDSKRTIWTISSISGNSIYVLNVHSNSSVNSKSYSSRANNNSYSVRPVLYLKSSIKIKSGTGEESNPYVFE